MGAEITWVRVASGNTTPINSLDRSGEKQG